MDTNLLKYMNKIGVTKMTNKTDTNDLKKKAIKLALGFPSITGTAKSLGIPEATLHTSGLETLKIAENN